MKISTAPPIEDAAQKLSHNQAPEINVINATTPPTADPDHLGKDTIITARS